MSEKTSTSQIIIVAVLSALALFLGVGGGWLLRGREQTVAVGGEAAGNGEAPSQAVTATVAGDTNTIKNGDVFGAADASPFPDSAQGYLQAGGINGEGSHALLRVGGASQTVYLTSSSTDLDKFVGMDVRVWGETMEGRYAGWLMDVGRVEVVNIKGTDPTE